MNPRNRNTYNKGAFCAYMGRYAVSKGMEFTHTSIIKPSGSFYVSPDNFEDFLQNYELAMDHGEDLHMTEKHREICPILIDMDFRFKKEVVTRQYTMEMIKECISVYIQQFKNYLELPPSYLIYVLEKSTPVADKKYMKDGIHIMIPDIVTGPIIQLLVRQKILPALQEILKPMELENTIENVIDEAVIERNNWQMYGSKKPNCEAYKVTKIFDQDIIEQPVPSDDTSFVKILSIRNKFDETPTKIDKADEIKTFIDKRKKSRVDMSKPMFKPNYTKNVCENIDWVCKIVDVLNPTRADGYESWIRVGWCLRNIDHRLLNKWIEFSQKSQKYTEGECERFWNMMRDDGLGIGTLCMWAKEDDHDAFTKILEQDLNSLILKSLSETHFDIAKVVHFMYRYNYACINIRNNQWYEFKEHRWVSCDGAYTLRQKISTDVFKKYMTVGGQLSTRASIENDEDRQKEYAEKIKKINGLALNLKKSPFKDNIIKECRELFYQEKFEDKLDSRCHLIGFLNGVYDLETMEFRDGHPEDFVSITTGNNYIPYDPQDPAQEGIDRFVSSIFPKHHIKEYVLKFLGSALNGSVREEKFHIWTGVGCHAPNTPIMMSDGSIKNVQDIVVGDQLMGDDSQPRNVLQLFQGKSDMFKITPDNGEPFVVNGAHVLSLKVMNSKVLMRTSTNNWVLTWLEHKRNRNIVIKTMEFTSFKEASIYESNLSNYLDNGDVIDITVNQYLELYDHIVDHQLCLYKVPVDFKTHTKKKDAWAKGVILANGDDTTIPIEYKYNTREVRSTLLAGILAGNLTPKKSNLMADTIWLAQSLGYSITADKMTIRKMDLASSFTVEKVEDGDYYGFELDGNHRYLMADFTVTHNSNGKSALIDLFEHSYGEYCCKFPVTLLTMKRAASNAPTAELARSKGRRFAVLQEPGEDEKMNVGLMKELTGGDKIMARQLYKDPIEFKPQFKMVLTCNHLPNVPSDDGGTWRRIRVVEFTSRFCEEPNPDNPNEYLMDKDLGKKFEDWKEHFMSLLIRYYQKYITEGLKEPDEVLKCTKDYQRSNDIMMDFMEQELERCPETEGAWVTVADVYQRFTSWIKDNIPQMKSAISKKTLKTAIGKIYNIGRNPSNEEALRNCKLRIQSSYYDDDGL